MNILHGDEVFVHSAQTHSQMTMSQAMRREQMQPTLKNKIHSAQLTAMIRKHPRECQIVPPGGDKQNCKHRMTGGRALKETEQKEECSLFGITRI